MSYPYKLPAFSLLETMIAMVVVMLSFGLATTLFVYVGKSSQKAKVITLIELQQMGKEAIENAEFFDAEWDRESIRIERRFEAVPNLPLLAEMHLIAFNGKNQVITEWKEIVRIE